MTTKSMPNVESSAGKMIALWVGRIEKEKKLLPSLTPFIPHPNPGNPSCQKGQGTGFGCRSCSR